MVISNDTLSLCLKLSSGHNGKMHEKTTKRYILILSLIFSRSLLFGNHKSVRDMLRRHFHLGDLSELLPLNH